LLDRRFEDGGFVLLAPPACWNNNTRKLTAAPLFVVEVANRVRSK
jgi:hypothetical protein